VNQVRILDSTNKLIIPIDLMTLIRNFKEKVKDDYPNVFGKFLYLTTRQNPSMLEEVIGAVRSFQITDSVNRPIVEFVAE
jgi:hypothetical protein